MVPFLSFSVSPSSFLPWLYRYYPGSVSVKRRVLRTKSCTPSSFSSDNICWDIADCDIKHSSAAGVHYGYEIFNLPQQHKPPLLSQELYFYCKVLILLSVNPLRRFFINFSYFCYKAMPYRIKACFLIIYYHIQQTKLKTNCIFNAIYKKFL